MGRLPTAFPETVSAAEQARRYLCDGPSRPTDGPPSARRRANVAELLATLADIEAVHSGGGADVVPAALLRRLVIASTELTGHRWLAAFGDDAAVAALAELRISSAPPPLPVLDLILATVLWRRFGSVHGSVNGSAALATGKARRSPAVAARVADGIT